MTNRRVAFHPGPTDALETTEPVQARRVQLRVVEGSLRRYPGNPYAAQSDARTVLEHLGLLGRPPSSPVNLVHVARDRWEWKD